MLVIKMIKELLSLLIVVAMCVGLFFQQTWVEVCWFVLVLLTITLLGVINCSLNEDEVLNKEQIREGIKAFPNDKPYSILNSILIGVIAGVMLITEHYLLTVCYVLSGVLYYFTHIKIRKIIKNNGGV